ncbi:unnamed protein product [Prorocentrum cordatum]|uniref:Uncharacterized protein n=1 Tax=Prorocentrum cordatum TaxID=2364126 RepID=A0ABN9Q3B2_9DINO|nr:unnamed protein product [Polarella glacialis]
MERGTRVFVKYAGHPIWHERLLLEKVGDSATDWIIATPDSDVYMEDFSRHNEDIEGFRLSDRRGGGPHGIDPQDVYRFRQEPEGAHLQGLREEARLLARSEAARGGGAPAGNADLWYAIEEAPGIHTGSVVRLTEEAVISGDRAIHTYVHDGVEKRVFCVRCPAADLADVKKKFRIETDDDGDARTLPIKSVAGQRKRDFSDAVEKMELVSFSDWETHIPGPRTTRWCLDFLRRRNGPLAHHEWWKSTAKLNSDDYGVSFHEAVLRAVQTGAEYDQLDLVNLASMEHLLRSAQLIERLTLLLGLRSFEGAELSSDASGEGSTSVRRLLPWVAHSRSSSEVMAFLSRVYKSLVARLQAAGLVEFSLTDGVRTGIFAVWKSDGVKQRLILDARISNCSFEVPESPDLPTVNAFSRRYFTMEPLSAKDLQISEGTGRQLSRLVGHFVSMALVKRETLCCLNAVYAFMAKHPEDSAPFWPSVVRELRWIQSLLPLLVHDLAKPFSSRVLACDASMWGKGVAHKSLSVGTIRDLSQYSERWRYHGTSGSARTGALEEALGGALPSGEFLELSFADEGLVPNLPTHVLESPILVRDPPTSAARRRRPARKRPAAAQPSRTAIETSKSHPDAEERKKARRSLHALERRSLQAVGRSFLEQGSVSRTVQQQCKAALDRFVKDQSIRDLHALARTPKVLDQKLKCHLDDLYFEGELSGVANTLVSLPETARALVGFSKLSPAASRLPIPATVVFGLAMVLCSLGFPLAAFGSLLAFHLYLRPSELMRMKWRHWSPPCGAGRGGTDGWCLTLHPREDGVQSKAEEFDENISIDADGHLSFLNQVMSVMHAKAKREARLDELVVGDLGGRSFLMVFKMAGERLGLPKPPVAHQLRHAGPSYDLAQRIRRLAEVKARGRWSADSSVRRYGKQNRINEQIAALPVAVRGFCDDAWKKIGDVLLKRSNPLELP